VATCLDLYGKLIIATFSFIAPLIIFILNTEGLVLIENIGYELERQTTFLLMQKSFDNDKIRLFVAETKKRLMKQVKRYDKLKKTLDPTRQLVRIFLTLLLSLCFQMSYNLASDKNLFPCTAPKYTLPILSVSVIFFIASLTILKKVAFGIIYAKKMILEEKSAIVVPNQDDN